MVQFFREERGQSTVETMLIISVMVIAMVSAAWIFVGGPSGFETLMASWDASEVYAKPVN